MLNINRAATALALAVTALAPMTSVAQQPQRLSVFIDQTINLHPAVRAAEKNLSKAKASASAAGQYPYNPELSAGYEEAAEKTKEFGLSQTIDVWGRRSSAEALGFAEIEIARAEYDLVRTDLLEALLRSLGANRKQTALLRLAEKRLDLSVRFLNLTGKFAAAGDIGRADVLTAEVGRSNAVLQVAAAKAAVADAQTALIALAGEQRTVWPKPAEIVGSAFDALSPDVEKTPEMIMTRATLNASKAGIDVAGKLWLPDPTVGVRVGKDGDSSLFGVSLSVPLPVWNRGSAEKIAASEDAASKEFLVAETRRRLNARLATAEVNLRSASEAVTHWRSIAQPTVARQEALLNRLSEAREIGALEYLQQLDRLLETEALGIELEQSLWSAWIDRLRAGANLLAWVEELK